MELKDFLQQEDFIVKCQWGISLMNAKLEMINAELSMRCGRKVIHSYSSRIKSYDSIAAKLKKKGLSESVRAMEEHVNDMVGVRAVCTYTDDLYRIGEMLCAQRDLRLLKKKDYIKSPKKSGYRSLHLIFQVPVSFQDEVRWIKIEVQLRTGAMDYWAGLDYQLQYKKENSTILKELRCKSKEKYPDINEQIMNTNIDLDRQ